MEVKTVSEVESRMAFFASDHILFSYNFYLEVSEIYDVKVRPIRRHHGSTNQESLCVDQWGDWRLTSDHILLSEFDLKVCGLRYMTIE